jgi:dihydroxyacetone kinase
MDGTSGALYAIFLNAVTQSLRQQSEKQKEEGPISVSSWATALKFALDTLGTYTPAQPGDRTVIDALAPFVARLSESGDVRAAVEAAREGCESTKGMQASLGRSVYVGGDKWKNCPDPGAYGLLKLLEGFVDN